MFANLKAEIKGLRGWFIGRGWVVAVGIASLVGWVPLEVIGAEGEVAASTSAAGSAPRGAVEGDRFAVEGTKMWEGKTAWWWQIRFEALGDVGAILQI